MALGAANAPCHSLPGSLCVYSGQIAFLYSSAAPGMSCSGTVCDNAGLRDFIAGKTDSETAAKYREGIRQIREVSAAAPGNGVVMKKEQLSDSLASRKNVLSNTIIGIVAAGVAVFLVVFVRKRRKAAENID